MTLIAKPIVKDQLWVITDGKAKVGNVVAENNGYKVKIGDDQQHFTSTPNIESVIDIHFLRPSTTKRTDIPYAIWPTTGRTYNDAFDLKRKLHVYTKHKKSRCYHVAGWFKINTKHGWRIYFCPKQIMVNRYRYNGPFMSEEQAANS